MATHLLTSYDEFNEDCESPLLTSKGKRNLQTHNDTIPLEQATPTRIEKKTPLQSYYARKLRGLRQDIQGNHRETESSVCSHEEIQQKLPAQGYQQIRPVIANTRQGSEDSRLNLEESIKALKNVNL